MRLTIFPKRRLLIFLLILGAFGAWLASWAFWYEPRSLTVQNYAVRIAEWNPAHDNFKIVMISDVHGGANFVDETKIRQVVELANQQNADLIVLLGDFVSQNFYDRRKLKMEMPVIADNLRGLTAKHGVFAVLGNHDYWYNDAQVRAELERVGYTVLENEAVTLNHDGADLILLGLPDVLKSFGAGVSPTWGKYSQNGKDALAKLNKTGNIIALTHNPDSFYMINNKLSVSPDLRILLAGHTHGGQCSFPIIGTPMTASSYGQRFAKGHFVENNQHLFVTSGIGTSILPVRFRVPPEISVLQIKKDE